MYYLLNSRHIIILIKNPTYDNINNRMTVIKMAWNY